MEDALSTVYDRELQTKGSVYASDISARLLFSPVDRRTLKPFRKTDSQFTSSYVQTQVELALRQKKTEMERISAYVNMMSARKLTPGKLYEKAALRYIAKAMANGKELQSELLYDGGNKSPSNTLQLSCGGLEVKPCNDFASAVKDHGIDDTPFFVESKKHSEEFIDGFFVGKDFEEVLGFQVTSNENHLTGTASYWAEHVDQVQQKAKDGATKARVIWVVPENRFEKFRAAKMKNTAKAHTPLDGDLLSAIDEAEKLKPSKQRNEELKTAKDALAKVLDHRQDILSQCEEWKVMVPGHVLFDHVLLDGE